MGKLAFIEILEKQLRSDLREELLAELRSEMSAGAQETTAEIIEVSPKADAADRFATWMAANVESSFFTNRAQAQRAYGQPKAKSTSTSLAIAPRLKNTTAPQAPIVSKFATRQAQSAEDMIAVVIIEKLAGVSLPKAFSQADLKQAWRKAAFRVHPDQASNSMSEQSFIELTNAYTQLRGLFAPVSMTQAVAQAA